MSSVKQTLLLGAAIAALMNVQAYAADMPPQIVYQAQPVAMPMPQQEFNNWYLRGDIGVGMTVQTELEYIKNPANPPNNFIMEHTKLGDSTIYGVGVGYQFNDWLRFDVTGEYRSRVNMFAFGSYSFGGGTFLDVYNANIKSYIFMANAYADLGTWWCFTPFVGVGVGFAHNNFEKLSDFSNNAGRGFAQDTSTTELAWAIHAGVAYEITKNFKMEMSYRYLDYGSVESAINCVGGCAPDSYKLKDLSSHDFRLGFRWMFGGEGGFVQRAHYAPPPPPVYAPPPPQVITVPAPQPVYQQPQYAPPPAPVYQQPQYAPPPPQPTYQQQPPLMRRG